MNATTTVQEYISLAAALKHATFNSKRGRAQAYPDSVSTTDKWALRKEFISSRQLLTRGMIESYIREGADSKREFQIFFNHDVFVILENPLVCDFGSMMKKFGFGVLSGTLTDIIGLGFSCKIQKDDIISLHGTWKIFGDRRLLSSYQAIAQYVKVYDGHTGEVKRDFPKKPKKLKAIWSVSDFDDINNKVRCEICYNGLHVRLTAWSDGDVMFFNSSSKDFTDVLPDAFISVQFSHKAGQDGCLNTFEKLVEACSDQTPLYDATSLVEYLDKNYPAGKVKNIAK